MKKLIVFLLVIVLSGCVQIVVPTEAPTDTPAPTKTSQPTKTSEPTKAPEAIKTPDPNDTASEFIETMTEFFWYFEQVYQNPPVAIELVRLEFVYVEDSGLYLVMETKSSTALIQDKSALVDSIATLSTILDDDWQLPAGITGVWFAQSNSRLEVQEMYYLDWGVFMAYVDGEITTKQMLEEMKTPDQVPLEDSSYSWEPK